jgi:aminoglycoside phosphotransferase (APT) family kinase protein
MSARWIERGVGSGTPKLGWDDLPGWLRAAIEEVVAARVAGTRMLPGGFSPSAALLADLEGGARVFVKAASEEQAEESVRMHRREADLLPRLADRPEVPELLGVIDEAGWVALVLEAVDGRHPDIPWTDEDLDRVLRGLRGLAEGLTPSPVAAPTAVEQLGEEFRGWRRFRGTAASPADPWAARHVDELAALEARWEEAGSGRSLVHADLRADQILLTARGIAVVDWAHASIGAPWLDIAFMAPSVTLQGGPSADEVLRRSGAAAAVDERDIVAVVAAITGFFLWGAAQPSVPGLPTLRDFQRAQGEVALDWLRLLVGWT